MKKDNIIGIYLAAGSSSRMGKNKLALPLKGKPLGSLALTTAVRSKLDHTLVVVRQAEEPPAWIKTEFSGNSRNNWSFVSCPNAGQGMSSSLKCGVKAALGMEAAALLIMLADQPFIQAGMVNHLIVEFQKRSASGDQIEFVASSFKGEILPPILFAKSIFPLLLKLEGDQGARKLVREGSRRGVFRAYDDWRLFYDIDTKEDYEKARGCTNG
ncbi:nucleotidyltransferase family protein [Heyndrickxia acidiproducens]|uniref:nucleotidyltransferase family protein n=1 Tax=Heyndrickxia acidiproducens TaxID=1121084 RepID=UPI0003663A58|nr:nucleotidyltransferase family protein [Heyndrickxia acidiproducens]